MSKEKKHYTPGKRFWFCYLPTITAGCMCIIIFFLVKCNNGFLRSLLNCETEKNISTVLIDPKQISLDGFYNQLTTFYSTIIILLISVVTLLQIAAMYYYNKKTATEAERILHDHLSNEKFEKSVIEIFNDNSEKIVENQDLRKVIQSIIMENSSITVLQSGIDALEKEQAALNEEYKKLEEKCFTLQKTNSLSSSTLTNPNQPLDTK